MAKNELDAKNELCMNIKNKFGTLSQTEIEEVFKIIYKSNELKNFNKCVNSINGINVNLSNLDKKLLEDIYNYIIFCIKSHNEITKYENICNSYIDVINKEQKEIKEELPNENTETITKNKQKISSHMKFYLLKKKFMKQTNTQTNKIDKSLTHEEFLIYN